MVDRWQVIIRHKLQKTHAIAKPKCADQVYIALELDDPCGNTMWPLLLERELEEALRRGAVRLPEPSLEDLSYTARTE